MDKSELRAIRKQLFSSVQDMEPGLTEIVLRYEFDQCIPEEIAIVCGRQPRWIPTPDHVTACLRDFLLAHDGEKADGLFGLLISVTQSGIGTRYIRGSASKWSVGEGDYGSQNSVFTNDNYLQPASILEQRRQEVLSSGQQESHWKSLGYCYSEVDVDDVSSFLRAPVINDVSDSGFVRLSALELVLFNDGRFFEFCNDPDAVVPTLNEYGEQKNYHVDRDGLYWRTDDGKSVFHFQSNADFEKYDDSRYVAYDDGDTCFTDICIVDADKLFRVISAITDGVSFYRWVYVYQQILS